MNNKVVCTIIARGGGSTLYRKNLYPLLGKPVIAWAIEILQKADFIDDIVVWSEDEEIQNIAGKYNVLSIDRPKEMVHYYSGFHNMHEWYAYRQTRVHEALGYTGRYEMNFNCNNILIRPESLNAMFRLLKTNSDWACRIQGTFAVEPELCLKSRMNSALIPFWNDPELPKSEHPPLYRLLGVGIGDITLCSNASYSPIYYHFDEDEGFDFQYEDDIPFTEFALARRHGLNLEG